MNNYRTVMLQKSELLVDIALLNVIPLSVHPIQKAEIR